MLEVQEGIRYRIMWIVPAGLMDEDAQVGVRGHIWVENKPHWEVIGDDAPQFMTVPPAR